MFTSALVLLRQVLFLCTCVTADSSNSSIARPARDLARPVVLEDQQCREDEGDTIPHVSRSPYIWHRK